MDNSNNKKQQSQQVPPQPQFQQAPLQQPQFQQAPQQSQQLQQMPPQPMAGTPYQMPPKKKMSKGALWGIIGGIIGLIILIVGVVLAVVLLSGPTKDDYGNLLSQFTNSDIKGVFKSNDGSKISKDELDKAIEKIDDLNKKMGSHKALRDKDVKEAYDKYLDRWNNGAKEYFEFAAILAEDKTYEKCKSPDINKYFQESKENFEKRLDSETKDCIDYLDKISKSENKLASKYGKTWKNYYTEMKRYYMAIVEYAQNPKSGEPLPKAPKVPESNISTEALEKWEKAGENFKRVLEDKANK